MQDSIDAIVYCARLRSGRREACSVGSLRSMAGWSSLVARWTHNPEVVSSNLTPATDEAIAATIDRSSKVGRANAVLPAGVEPRPATTISQTIESCPLSRGGQGPGGLPEMRKGNGL